MFKKVFLRCAVIIALAMVIGSVILGIVISTVPHLALQLSIVWGIIVVLALILSYLSINRKMKEYEKKREEHLSNVVHDLRSPMTTISGYTESMLLGVIPPEKHAHYLGIISDEIKRLSRLVNSLLDPSGNKKLDMTKFDVCEMSRQVLLSFEKRIEEKSLDVELEFGRERVLVLADSDAIYQVLYNICDNAIKFSREKGKLALSVTYNEKKKAEISIYNEGNGISDKDIPNVFNRFFKSGENSSGSGLGMFITKSIIDAHSETVKVESEAGKWCRFTFTLAQAEDNSI